MRVWEGLVARHQRRTALKLSGLDTALHLHQEEYPEWYDTDEDCSTCRKRRQRLQAAPHALPQAVERAGVRMSGVAADTSGARLPQRVEAYAVALADCREARRRQGAAILAECTAALQRSYDFILAEAFPSGRNVQRAARRVVLRVAELPAAAALRQALSDPDAPLLPPMTVTVEEYLTFLRDMWCPLDAWEAETRFHLTATLLQNILPQLSLLYDAAVAAAAGVTAATDLPALQEASQRAWIQRLALLQAQERDDSVQDTV